MPETLTADEALIWVMVITSAADRTMSEPELDRIGHIVANLPALSGFAGSLPKIADACVARLRADDDLDGIIGFVAEALPDRLHETAYALAVEVAAADLEARQEELRFLQLLEDHFALPKLAVAAIEHSARVRHRSAR